MEGKLNASSSRRSFSSLGGLATRPVSISDRYGLGNLTRTAKSSSENPSLRRCRLIFGPIGSVSVVFMFDKIRIGSLKINKNTLQIPNLLIGHQTRKSRILYDE